MHFVLQTLWKGYLSNKFRNERKRHERDNPCFTLKRARISKNKPAEKTSAPNYWGVKNFLPKHTEGEDENSMWKQIKWMQLESRKTRQDVIKIGHCMELTLSIRRRMIVEEKSSIQDLKSHFPCLFFETEVSLHTS